MNLFRDLAMYRLIDEWVPLLDWLLSNNRFSTAQGWNTNKRSRFTKAVKKLPNVGKDDWTIQPAKATTWQIDESKKVHVIMTSDSGIGEAFIRHIRNGIAHGEARIIKLSTGLQLDICDFRDDKHTQQTAHLWLPVDMLFSIYGLYMKIEKGVEK